MARSWRSQIADEVRATSMMKPKEQDVQKIIEEECNACQVSSSCPECEGNGDPCSVCDGTGDCQRCEGEGVTYNGMSHWDYIYTTTE